MKIISIQIFSQLPDTPNSAALVASALDLSSFSFYQRGIVGDFVNFTSRTVADRTSLGERQSVKSENGFTAHSYARTDNLVGLIITDSEYPIRVVFSLLNKILDEFITKFKKSDWEDKANESRKSGKQVLLDSKELNDYIVKYQDPKQADTIMRVQQELDETKIILHKTIEGVLERGEKLDTLVAKSAELSATSKQFHKTAKSQNSCCTLM